MYFLPTQLVQQRQLCVALGVDLVVRVLNLKCTFCFLPETLKHSKGAKQNCDNLTEAINSIPVTKTDSVTV